MIADKGPPIPQYASVKKIDENPDHIRKIKEIFEQAATEIDAA